MWRTYCVNIMLWSTDVVMITAQSEREISAESVARSTARARVTAVAEDACAGPLAAPNTTETDTSHSHRPLHTNVRIKQDHSQIVLPLIQRKVVLNFDQLLRLCLIDERRSRRVQNAWVHRIVIVSELLCSSRERGGLAGRHREVSESVCKYCWFLKQICMVIWRN